MGGAVGSIVSAVAGPAIQGAMSDDGSGAVDAQVGGINQATLASRAATEKAIQEILSGNQMARTDLDKYYTAGTRLTKPYEIAGYGANDMIREQLGVPGPRNSIEYLAMLDNKDKQDAAIADRDRARNILSSGSGLSSLDNLVNDVRSFTGANNEPVVAGMPTGSLQEKLDYLRRWENQTRARFGQASVFANRMPLAERVGGALPGIEREIADLNAKANSNPAFLTEEEAARLERYARGDFSEPGVTAQNTSTNALSKFLNSAEYRLLFDQGGKTMDPNATALERFKESPGYQFAVDEGQKALQSAAAARGGVLGGNALAELTKLRMGMADQEFTDHQNRLQQTYGNFFNRLNNVSGTGANITSQGRALALNQGATLADLETNKARTLADLITNQGTVDANAAIAAGNARASGYLNQANQNNQVAGNIFDNLGTVAKGDKLSGLSGFLQKYF